MNNKERSDKPENTLQRHHNVHQARFLGFQTCWMRFRLEDINKTDRRKYTSLSLRHLLHFVFWGNCPNLQDNLEEDIASIFREFKKNILPITLGHFEVTYSFHLKGISE
jgi:hypothetical protein